MNRSKRKRRRRADKALTGSEKVKLINMITGKKVRPAVNLSHALDWLELCLINKHTHLFSIGRSCFLSNVARPEGISGGES